MSKFLLLVVGSWLLVATPPVHAQEASPSPSPSPTPEAEVFCGPEGAEDEFGFVTRDEILQRALPADLYEKYIKNPLSEEAGSSKECKKQALAAKVLQDISVPADIRAGQKTGQLGKPPSGQQETDSEKGVLEQTLKNIISFFSGFIEKIIPETVRAGFLSFFRPAASIPSTATAQDQQAAQAQSLEEFKKATKELKTSLCPADLAGCAESLQTTTNNVNLNSEADQE